MGAYASTLSACIFCSQVSCEVVLLGISSLRVVSNLGGLSSSTFGRGKLSRALALPLLVGERCLHTLLDKGLNLVTHCSTPYLQVPIWVWVQR